MTETELATFRSKYQQLRFSAELEHQTRLDKALEAAERALAMFPGYVEELVNSLAGGFAPGS